MFCLKLCRWAEPTGTTLPNPAAVSIKHTKLPPKESNQALTVGSLTEPSKTILNKSLKELVMKESEKPQKAKETPRK